MYLYVDMCIHASIASSIQQSQQKQTYNEHINGCLQVEKACNADASWIKLEKNEQNKGKDTVLTLMVDGYPSTIPGT